MAQPILFSDSARNNEGTSELVAHKSLKKKKSLPRLFILSRQKSFKSQPAPPSASTKEAEPCLPTTANASIAHADPSPTSSYQNFSRNRQMSGARRVSDEQGAADGTKSRIPSRENSGSQGTTSVTRPALHESQARTTSAENSLTQHHKRSRFGRGPLQDISPQSTVSYKHDIFSGPKSMAHTNTFPTSARPHTSHSTSPLMENGSRKSPYFAGSARQAHERYNAHQRSPIPDQWQTWQTSEPIRESIRSGLSTASSTLDSGSTEQSSIFTKMSSISDTTMDFDDTDSCKDGMTVDDAIDLYAEGFEDDDDEVPGQRKVDALRPPEEDYIQRRSQEIAAAINDTVNTTILIPRPASIGTPNSAAIMSGDIFYNMFPHPPPLRRPDHTHDQYGFRKASRDVTVTQYDEHHEEYAKMQARRTAKWERLMQDHGLPTTDPTKFPKRSTQVQRFIRKGIPPAWRGNAWFFYAGGDEFLSKYPDLYSQLVNESRTSKLSHNDRESIERDLHRTFPDNVHFKLEEPITPSFETPLVASLRRVLRAFAIHHPRIGYCQSLNFIAGLLLLFLPEEKAFWMLHILTKKFLPGTHDLSLEGANVDLWVLMLALKDSVPAVWAKVGGEVHTNTLRLPPISLCTTSWFMSLFIGTLPIESVLRVWDVLFYEGCRTLFRTAIAIFKLGETEIKSITDPMEIFQVVQSLPRRMLDVGKLLGFACKRGGVSQSWVERKRRERKDWYARERALLANKEGPANHGNKDTDGDGNGAGASTGNNSLPSSAAVSIKSPLERNLSESALSDETEWESLALPSANSNASFRTRANTWWSVKGKG